MNFGVFSLPDLRRQPRYHKRYITEFYPNNKRRLSGKRTGPQTLTTTTKSIQSVIPISCFILWASEYMRLCKATSRTWPAGAALLHGSAPAVSRGRPPSCSCGTASRSSSTATARALHCGKNAPVSVEGIQQQQYMLGQSALPVRQSLARWGTYTRSLPCTTTTTTANTKGTNDGVERSEDSPSLEVGWPLEARRTMKLTLPSRAECPGTESQQPQPKAEAKVKAGTSRQEYPSLLRIQVPLSPRARGAVIGWVPRDAAGSAQSRRAVEASAASCVCELRAVIASRMKQVGGAAERVDRSLEEQEGRGEETSKMKHSKIDVPGRLNG
ncbi:hypothetical protein AAL_08381 [Moelleriella libera RCEF 2490]|uniref:Uncharacterized protein n=1 Tax=Moelleriella libera RCEF 2490 TaxID=1081109 RepID=A0A166N3D1_9HYPO|nr:hypothetical protein AAL_08381 [Moelleriella libera RCEF 2490]